MKPNTTEKKIHKFFIKLSNNIVLYILNIEMKRNSGSQNKQFNPTPFSKPGLTPEEVLEIKYTFDLFDTDQGGSIDTKGTSWVNVELKAAMISLGFDSKNATIFQMVSDLD